MNRFVLPLLLLVLATLAACGSTHKKLDRPREEIAELRGRSSEFKLLGTTQLLLFTSLDGTPFEKSWAASHPDVLDVLPGKHRVGVFYSVKFDGQPGPQGDLEADVDAVAGRIYQAELLFTEGKGYTVEFRETGSATAEARAVESQD